MYGYELEAAKYRQSHLLFEAGRESLAKEAKRSKFAKSFRQKMGASLVKLGQSLSKESLSEQA
jgi:hypothetical protein